MKLLLDTHAFLWAVVSPDHLSRRARQAIESRRNDLLISAVSIYEIILKNRMGKLSHADAVRLDPAAAMRDLAARELPIDAVHARIAASFESTHRDPFDRFLAAQAIAERVLIVTNDGRIAELGAKTFW